MGMALIAREGDSLASIGINMTVTAFSLFNAANAEGGANALSDNGWLTFRVSGTGAGSGYLGDRSHAGSRADISDRAVRRGRTDGTSPSPLSTKPP